MDKSHISMVSWGSKVGTLPPCCGLGPHGTSPWIVCSETYTRNPVKLLMMHGRNLQGQDFQQEKIILYIYGEWKIKWKKESRFPDGTWNQAQILSTIELSFNSSWHLVGSWLFCFLNLPCLVSFRCWRPCGGLNQEHSKSVHSGSNSF